MMTGEEREGGNCLEACLTASRAAKGVKQPSTQNDRQNYRPPSSGVAAILLRFGSLRRPRDPRHGSLSAPHRGHQSRRRHFSKGDGHGYWQILRTDFRL